MTLHLAIGPLLNDSLYGPLLWSFTMAFIMVLYYVFWPKAMEQEISLTISEFALHRLAMSSL